MAIFNCTGIGVYKERFIRKGRPIAEPEIAVALERIAIAFSGQLVDTASHETVLE